MNTGSTKIYYGNGEGKSAAAVGKAFMSALEGKSVIFIQFMKRDLKNIELIKKLEPEIKFFRFEKTRESYEDLNDEQKKEEQINIKNGLNFAKKVLATGECDLLVLDEVSALVDEGLISCEELINVLNAKDDETGIIITGRTYPEEIVDFADSVTKFETEK